MVAVKTILVVLGGISSADESCGKTTPFHCQCGLVEFNLIPLLNWLLIWVFSLYFSEESNYVQLIEFSDLLQNDIIIIYFHS